MPAITEKQFAPRNILVPTDFSASADAAVLAATELALEFDSGIYLLHVIQTFSFTTGAEFPTSFYPEQEMLTAAQDQASQRLAHVVSRLAAIGVRASHGVEVWNDVVGKVCIVAAREKADLIVISTHGMTGWRPFLFGSIADKVIKQAECPILLLRSVTPAVDGELKGGS
jgi:nucleotide-binding universal stress UspA family protein